MVMVVVYFLTFYFHVASLESFKAKSREKVEEPTTLTLQSKANKDNNHINFLSDPRPKLMID
jgi:hypothetical protein